MTAYQDSPSVPDVFTAPQLASLRILDLVLETTITALTAAHLDPLWDDDFIQFEERPDPVLVGAAREIIEQAEDLRAAIGEYRPDTTPPWARENDRLDRDGVRQLWLDLGNGEGGSF